MESQANSPTKQITSAEKRKLETNIEDNQPNKKQIKTSDLNEEVLVTYQKKEYTDCLKLIDESLEINPTNTHHKILQTSCWTMLDINGIETYETLKSIIQEDPKNSFAYYGIGLKHYADGELMESVEYFNKAISLNPTNSMQKAVELKQKATRVMEAICDGKCEMLSRNETYFYFLTANIKFETNNIEKALKVLSAAMFTDPENLKVQANISNLRHFYIKDLVRRLESEVKTDVLTKCQKLEAAKKLKKAEDFIKADKTAEAEKLLEDVSEIDPQSDELVYLKGFFLYMSGSLKQAIPLIEEALNLNPNLEKAKELREKAEKLCEYMDASAEKMCQKKHTESIELLTKAISVDEGNQRINQAAYFQRALAYFTLGNSSKAFADFKKFEALQKGN